MLKKLLLLFILFCSSNFLFARDTSQAGVITKDERCAIAKENLRALSDLSKPIYQRDDNGKLIELTYAQILEQRRQNQQLVASLCNLSKEIRIQKSFYSNAINRAKTAAGVRTQTSVDLALRQALINRDFDEVYTILVYVEDIGSKYAIEFIKIAKNKSVDAAVWLYQQQYKNKAAKKDKNKKTDQQKEKDKYKTPVNDKNAKEASKDVPSWAKGKRPYKWENGKEYAKRLMDERYGKGKWEEVRGRGIRDTGKGRKCEFCELKKHGDRGFK